MYFSGVVSREIVHVALTCATLNDLPIYACDIQNTDLQDPSSEKYYVVCSPEFGLENAGKHEMIVRGFYGGKSAGADYWRHVRSAMEDMGFSSCKADPDVWLRPSLNSNEVEHYPCVLICADDILAIVEETETFLREELGKMFTMKENLIGSPEQCLGDKVSLVTLENGIKFWSYNSSQCVQTAVKNLECYRTRSNLRPLLKAKSPWPYNYCQEADVNLNSLRQRSLVTNV